MIADLKESKRVIFGCLVLSTLVTACVFDGGGISSSALDDLALPEASTVDLRQEQRSNPADLGVDRHRDLASPLKLLLPHSSSLIVLRNFIDSHNPGNNKEIHITNSLANCAVATGDLSSLNVTFVNSGELQGLSKERTNMNSPSNSGFSATSPITFINNGWVRGGGGYGGKGGKGADDTYSTTAVDERYSGTDNKNNWQAYCDSGAVRIFWNGKKGGGEGNCSQTGPLGIGGVTGSFTRGSPKWNSGTIHLYSIKRHYTVSKGRTGGAGGAGGKGRGCDSSYASGASGSASNPSGGNSGGAGGQGGDWGAKGYTGSKGAGGGAAGIAGYAGAPAIVGSNHLRPGSRTGNVSGSTQ